MSLLQALDHALAAQQAAAVLDGDGSALSGSQLLRLAAAAARLVQQAASDAPCAAPGAPPVCAVFLSNSAAYVAAVLAALRLGLVFMPLDPDWPPHRLQQLCDEAHPAAVLWAAAGCPGGHGPPAISGWPLVQMPGMAELLQADAGAAEGQQAAPGQLQPALGQQQQQGPPGPPPTPANDACYLLYTSGSTGHPLGVLGTQAGVLNRCRWMERAYPFQAGGRVAFKTAPAFVDSVWEVFGPLLAGVPLVALPRSVGRDPAQLLRALADHSITHLAAVPTLWRALLVAMRQNSSTATRLQLRLAVSSGEPLPPGLLGDFQQFLPPSCRILNLYGSTEVAADCTAFDCTAWRPQQLGAAPQQAQQAEQQQAQEQAQVQQEGSEEDRELAQQCQQQRVPVGQPISGMLVAVLAPELGSDAATDRSSQPPTHGAAAAVDAAGKAGSGRAVLPLGSVGEVAVAGAGLAAGYLCCHPAAEAAQLQRFVQLPTRQLEQARAAGGSVAAAADLPPALWQQGSVRAFLTGDLGWLDASSCLHLLGRRDHQVKISGVRVDLAEVEATLAQHPGVAAAAAKLWHLPAGPVLAAYVQLAEQQQNGSSIAGNLGSSAAPSSRELQQWCQVRLPAAAVPQHVLVLPRLPRSAAGKVQRSQLAHPLDGAAVAAAAGEADATAAEGAQSAAATGGSAPPRKRLRSSSTTPAAVHQSPPAQPVSELAVSRAFAAALGHSEFEATTNLFSIGGNSLMAAQIAGEVAGGDVEAVFSHPTVRSLAAYLAGRPGVAETAGAAGPGGSGSQSSAGQKQAGTPEAASVLHARRMDVSSSAPTSEQQLATPSGRPQLRLAWRAKMLQCVDAAPVFETAAAAGGQQAAGSQVFACSHGGDVCCYEASSGKQLWSTQLPDQTDAGLLLCDGPPLKDGVGGGQQQQGQREQQPQQAQQKKAQQQQQQLVAVATNSGTLAFLRSTDGSLAGSLECGGGIRAPPVCDPWCGLVWQPTHRRQLVVAAAPGRATAQLALPAAVSAAVTFDVERRLAFVCCLDGSLVAVAVDPEQLAAAAAAAAGPAARECSSSGGICSSPLAVAWQHRASGPLFAPAALLPGGSIAVAAVDGSISCLSSKDGGQLWQTSVQGAVFAPMLLLSGAGPPALLVGTQAGQLAALDASTGRRLGTLQLGAKITGMQLLRLPATAAAAGAAADAEADGPAQHHLLVVPLAPGIVALVDVLSWLGGCSTGRLGSYMLDAVRLPAEVFAAPAVKGRPTGRALLAVGCRDDHLYCFSLS